jgi:DNA-binding NarL/FixJ family response regulator
MLASTANGRPSLSSKVSRLVVVNLRSVLIVDDHKAVTEGLTRLLRHRFEVVDAIDDGDLVLDAVARFRPDILILDLSMPKVDGFEAMRQLEALGVEPKVIVLTMHTDASLAVEALKAGAAGFVLKESGCEELLTAIDVVLKGGRYLSSKLRKQVAILTLRAADPTRVALTTRQREVLRLIVLGRRATEIAGALQMSTGSVEAIKDTIMRQLTVHSTAELVRYAVAHRLVTV